VTQGKLGAGSARVGQVLGTTGTAMQWYTPANGDITAVNTAAGSGLQGGVASGDANLAITEQGVTNGMLAVGAVDSSRIADGTVTSGDVAFTYAGSASKGGAANDLACTDCVAASEVQFNYAGASSEGGAASDVACASCVGSSEISSSGASSGQVLKYNGSGVAWAADSGLTLPPFPSASSTVGNDIIAVTNTGTGRAFHAVATGDTAIWAESTSGMGIDARSSSSVGLSATSTSNDAIQGWSSTSGKSGVFGRNATTTGHGVYGQNTSYGNGVRGWSSGGSGVVGEGATGVSAVNGYAVVSLATSSNYIVAAGCNPLFPCTNVFRVDFTGKTFANGGFQTGGADFAELLPARDGLEAGDVLAIGADGTSIRSVEAFQASVAGVYSTAPGYIGGGPDGADTSGKVSLAVVGVVPVKACSENGAIRPGDMLVASSTAGHAMRSGANPPIGTVLGKALSALDQPTGTVTLLLMPR
jgi:hypothetical protein